MFTRVLEGFDWSTASTKFGSGSTWATMHGPWNKDREGLPKAVQRQPTAANMR